MEITKFLAILAVVLPVAYGAPTAAAEQLAPQIVEAMKRDLGLDSEQAHARVARDIAATDIIEALRSSTGEAFAGAWIAEDGETLNVGITDESLSDEVTAAGATPVVFSSSFSKLEEAKLALDKIDMTPVSTLSDDSAPTGIAAYWVDVALNKIVFEALSASTSYASELAAQVGLEESDFEVQTVEEMPTPLITVRGGDAYYIGGGRCSIGFSVTTGFVTAGHCGRTGTAVQTSSGAALGSFAGSVFPGSGDFGYVRTTSAHTLQGRVNNYAGGTVAISGSTAGGVGSSICRSGSTTGVYCGSVQALGATVNYAEGSVTGLTRTNVCAEPGDSGGSWYTGSQAQGVTSGGNGNCRTGGTTYFQPVNEILSTYGLTLVRG